MQQVQIDKARQAPMDKLRAFMNAAGIAALLVILVGLGTEAFTGPATRETATAVSGPNRPATPSTPGPGSLDPQAPPTGETDAPLSDQAAPTRQLALTYQRAAARIMSQSPHASVGSDAVLADALRDTAESYRAAARSAERGDLAGYTAALAAAASGRQDVSTVLEGLNDGGDQAATPTAG